MIFRTAPDTFHPKFEVVSCFVEFAKANGAEPDLLFLLRQDHKPQPNTWGVPAGKKETTESKETAMIRELREESGIILTPADLQYVTHVFVKYPDLDFIYHMFRTRLNTRQSVIINPQEHKEHRWMTGTAALQTNLIPDLDDCIKLCYPEVRARE